MADQNDCLQAVKTKNRKQAVALIEKMEQVPLWGYLSKPGLAKVTIKELTEQTLMLLPMEI